MSNWNNNFTALLRESRPTFWGNWALNASIASGKVGILDSSSGEFTVLDDLPEAKIKEVISSQKWEVKSKDVTEKKTNVTLNGQATDPETKTKITAGIKVDWGFKKEGSLCSVFSTTKERNLDRFISSIEAQMPWLEELAESAGMKTPEGITQGFCVITRVLYAKSGLNVGAKSKKSTFSIEGSVSGVNEMIGDSLSGQGSYVSTSETASMDSHTWPSSPEELSAEDIPIAFSVASFDGEVIIPNWIQLLSTFELVLDNKHGGTYIAHGNLSYKVDGEKHTASHKASGGMRSAIRDIPINATELVYTVSFTSNKTVKKFEWDSPINQWLSGTRNIDVRGVWPGTPSAIDRESE